MIDSSFNVDVQLLRLDKAVRHALFSMKCENQSVQFFQTVCPSIRKDDKDLYQRLVIPELEHHQASG